MSTPIVGISRLKISPSEEEDEKGGTGEVKEKGVNPRGDRGDTGTEADGLLLLFGIAPPMVTRGETCFEEEEDAGGSGEGEEVGRAAGIVPLPTSDSDSGNDGREGIAVVVGEGVSG